MMSNGPCWSRRSCPQRLGARSSAASTSSGARRTWTWRKPSRCQAAQRAAQLRRCGGSRAGRSRGPGGSRCARRRLARAGRARWPRAARGAPGQLDQRLARLGLHVGGVDHGQPAGREPLGRRCSAAPRRRRWWPTGRSRRRRPGPAEVRREHLGGLEVLAGEGRLAVGDRRGSGGSPPPVEHWPSPGSRRSARRSVGEDRHLGGRADLGVVVADRQDARPCSRAGGDPPAQARNSAGSTRSGGRGGAVAGGQALEAHVVLDVGRGHDHRGRAGVAEHARSKRGSRAGRGARSPRRRRRRRSRPGAVAVGERPVEQVTRPLPLGQPVEAQRRAATASARTTRRRR